MANKFKEELTAAPYMRIWEIQEVVRERLRLYIGRTIAYRAKQIVLRKFMGDWKMEFARLCDYADNIKETNPGSSCFVKLTENLSLARTYFSTSMYVLMHSRKGSCKGELLVAVGRNRNQQIFSIAWNVVHHKTKHSWSWFLSHLIEDLQLGEGHGLTVISDMQKGLLVSVKELLPMVEQRMCARHIWSNWSKKWKGEERRKQFWRVAKACYLFKCNNEVANMRKLGSTICEDMMKYPRESWCRSFFQEHSRCDIVENNMCETFNLWILAARHKSIVTMLEEIRHKIMSRQVDMIKFAETWISDISPMARLTLEENKDLARECQVIWNVQDGFEVKKGDLRFIVDTRMKTCSCRLWRLRGIPCEHANAPGGSSSRQEAYGSQSSQPTQRSSVCDEATTTVPKRRGKAPSATFRPTKGAFSDALP
ncbi:uncharacterized protein LOC142180092 [Nicotiana tabacum]|uniref:Uncharacterized protein LOC142180092 n=1 Tax=Nicotiana tabacum TaxID=4097 RepID=A0AC58UC93_TOBAC